MLTIDNREPPTLRRDLLKRLKGEGAEARMLAGDFRIQHDDYILLVERKAASDLINSWMSHETTPDGQPISKLRRQLHACLAASTHTALLIEGQFEEDRVTGMIKVGGRPRQVRYQGLVRLLWDIQDEGVRILATHSREQTVDLLTALHNSLRRRNDTALLARH